MSEATVVQERQPGLAPLRLEGTRLSWQVIRRRFRFERIRPQVWLWAVPGALLALIGSVVLNFTSAVLVRIPLFTPPSCLSFLNPAVSQPAHSFLGVPLRGSWYLGIASTESGPGPSTARSGPE